MADDALHRGNGEGSGGAARGYSWEPFQPGHTLSMRHGATSERRIRPLARNHRRRVLRQLRLRASDIDAIGRAYLDMYVRAIAKVDLVDRYIDEHGLIRPDGQLQPVMKQYVSFHNAARQALARLEDHLRAREAEPSMVAVLQGEARRLEP